MSHTDTKIEGLKVSIQGQREFVDNLIGRAAEDERELSDLEKSNIDEATSNIERMGGDLKRLSEFQSNVSALEQIAPVTASRAAIYTAPRPEMQQTIGELFTASEQYRSYQGRGSSDVLTIASTPWDMQSRAVGPDPLTIGNTPGKELLPNAYKYRGPEHFPQYPLLGLVNRVEVSSSAIEVVTTTEASGHDEVAERAPKPPVVWTDSLVTYSLKMVAGWYKWSRQAQLDIPNVRGLIDSKLQQSLNKKLAALASAALLGGFTGGNTTAGAASSKQGDNIRLAIAALGARGIAPNAILMNPADHAALDIATMASTLLGPHIQQAYFGVPVYDIPDIPAKTAIVGNFSEAMTWFNRGGVNLYVTDSDVEDGAAGAVTSSFRANILTAILETYGVMALTDATALQKVTTP